MSIHSKDVIMYTNKLKNSCSFGSGQGWSTKTNDKSNFSNNVIHYLQFDILKICSTFYRADEKLEFFCANRKTMYRNATRGGVV